MIGCLVIGTRMVPAGRVCVGRPPRVSGRLMRPFSSIGVAGISARAPPRTGQRGLPAGIIRERPFRLFRRDLHAFDQGRVLRNPAMGLHIPIAIGVEDPEFHRVHAAGFGPLVHMDLKREIHRRDAEAAHRRGRAAVGVGNVDIRGDIRDGVGPGQMGRAFYGGIAREPRIGTGIEIGADLPGQNTAIAGDAVLDIDALGAARAAIEHLLSRSST